MKRYVDADKVPLLLRKGVFPYDWLNREAKFDEPQLPPKEYFESSLTEEPITDEDYAHANRTWQAFECKTFRDYVETYLKADVLQLADIFESFRDTCLKFYDLDPAPYLSSPNYTWDDMLKMTDVQLDLITDPEIFRMLDQGMRGGISTITRRHAKANNKYMDDRYNPNLPSKYIVYLDANNLYGWAMVQPTAYGGFEWMSKEELEVIENELKKGIYTSLGDNQEKGYYFDIDADYPQDLHPFHNDYPMAPEHMTVNLEMLNPIQATIRSKYNMPRRSEQTKLIQNLNPKRNYIVHYRNLKFYMIHGLSLNKINRGIKFKQAPWIAQYIQLNTTLRAKAENDFEKDKLKLFNNALFGKTCENQQKWADIKLVVKEEKAEKYLTKSNLKSFRIFHESLVGFEFNKINTYINKPFYVGFTVLELSKLLMYEFHYDFIVPRFGSNAKLLFTDTDSLMYEIETEDVYKDVAKQGKILLVRICKGF